MISAFGVEHGDISKAWTPRGKRKEAEQARRRAAQNEAYLKNRARAKKVGQIPGKVVGTKVSISDVGMSTGKIATKTGNLIAAKPGLTGAAVLGGGAYVGYRASQREGLPKRKRH